MYHYIYDAFLQNPRYAKILASIENRLTDLGIFGRIDRLALFKTMKGSIGEARRRGAKTIVAVGNDATIAKAVDAVAEQKGLVLGIIPVGEPQRIASLLSIPMGLEACDTLSARLIEELDLGRVNGHYFLHSMIVMNNKLSLICEGNYKVELPPKGEVAVCKLSAQGVRGASDDGYLYTIVKSKTTSFRNPEISVFPIKKLVIRKDDNEMIQARADGLPINDKEIKVEVVPKKLKVIIGKKRQT